MAGYQHILVAIDFSEESERIINKALELRRDGTKLSIIHIVEYTGTIYTGEIPLPETLDIDRELAAQAETKLEELKQNLGLDAELHVEIGIPKKEITRLAEENNADLIIIGSHGKHGLQLLLGSTANGVLHLAKCDVLAVRVGGH